MSVFPFGWTVELPPCEAHFLTVAMIPVVFLLVLPLLSQTLLMRVFFNKFLSEFPQGVNIARGCTSDAAALKPFAAEHVHLLFNLPISLREMGHRRYPAPQRTLTRGGE